MTSEERKKQLSLASTRRTNYYEKLEVGHVDKGKTTARGGSTPGPTLLTLWDGFHRLGFAGFRPRFTQAHNEVVGTGNETASDPGSGVKVFRHPAAAWVAVILAVCGTTVVALAKPAYLGWTLLVPIAVGAALIRRRTTVDADAITVRRSFSTIRLPWSELDGILLTKRGTVAACSNDGKTITLPAVGTSNLVELSAAAHGRMPQLTAPTKGS